MRQISLKLKSYTGSISVYNNDLERRVLRFLLMSFGVLGLFYVLILGNMVFNIIERRNLEEHVRVLSSEVMNLELSYLSISNNVDLPFSYSLGFKETNIKFTTRKALGSINGNIKTLQNEI